MMIIDFNPMVTMVCNPPVLMLLIVLLIVLTFGLKVLISINGRIRVCILQSGVFGVYSLESTVWSQQYELNTVPTVFSCLEKPFAAIVRLSGCKRKLDRMVRAYPERDLLAFKNSLLKKPERQSFKMVSLCIWLLNFRWCSRMMLFEWCCSSKLYRLEVFECALVLSSSLVCSDVLWCALVYSSSTAIRGRDLW